MEFVKILSPIITVIINATLSNIIFFPKRKLHTNLLVWFGMIVSLNCITIYFNSFFKQNILILYLVGQIYLLVCFYLYKNNYTQIAFTFFTIWAASSMFSSICFYISQLYFDYLNEQFQNIIRLVLFVLLYAIILLLVKYKMVESIRKLLDMFNKKFIVFSLFPVLCFTLFAVIFNPYNTDNISYSKLITMLMYISIVIFAYYFVFSTFSQIYAKSQIEERLRASQIHQALQKNYYDVLKKSIDKISRIQHDSKQHFISIQNLLNYGKIDELNNYISSLISREDTTQLPILCENSSTNAIISYYIERAKNSNIKTDIQISVPENINIDSIDLNVVFGNCLENAIEACLKLADKNQRYLNVKGAIVKNYFIIDISNSFNGLVNMQDDIIYSTKSDASNHGIGLESVKSLVGQYRGSISLTYTKDEFRTTIMMYNGSSS